MNLKDSTADDFKMLVQAARPTLFSATSRPELITSLVFANLMSERLWSASRQIAGSSSASPSGKRPAEMLARIHKFVNGRFYHARPLEFARIYGLHEREYIADAADLEANDYAMGILARGFEQRMGKVSWAPMLLEFLKMGLFPEYVYPTVDVILAHRPLLRDLPGKPLGMTSCADECILIASLALALRCCNLDDIIFLGSPFHYSLFLFPEGGDGFWFNAKREFFEGGSWKALHGGGSGGNAKQAFEERMLIFDRVITPRGHAVFPLKKSTLSRVEVHALLEKMNRFLGMELEVDPDVQEKEEVRLRGPLPSIEGCTSGEEFSRRVREWIDVTRGPSDAACLYTFRHIDVPDPSVYVSAALNGYKSLLRSAEVSNLDDAVSMVSQIPGRESIFGGSSRVALPDEVLLFDTANGNERMLLLYALLMHSPAFPRSDKDAFSIGQASHSWSIRCLNREFVGADL